MKLIYRGIGTAYQYSFQDYIKRKRMKLTFKIEIIFNST